MKPRIENEHQYRSAVDRARQIMFAKVDTPESWEQYQLSRMILKYDRQKIPLLNRAWDGFLMVIYLATGGPRHDL